MTALKFWNGTGWSYVQSTPLAHTHQLADITSLAALPDRGFRRATAALRFDPAFGRSQFPGTGGVSNGTDTYGNYQSSHAAVADTTDVWLVFVNAYAHEDVAVPNPIAVRASVIWGGAAYQGRTESGSSTLTLEPGAFGVLRVGGLYVPKGSFIKVHTNVVPTTSVGSGGVWPLAETTSGGVSSGLSEGGATGTGANTDLTGSTADITGSVYAYRPLVVCGTPAAVPPVVIAAVTDSIGVGVGDSTGPFLDAGKGFLRRAVNDTRPMIHLGAGGETAQNLAQDKYRVMRGMLISGCSHVISNLGRNDLAASRTLAQIQADLLAFATYCTKKGAKVFQTTITPDTTSTDSYATASNQTPRAWNSVRIALNTWLRAGAPIDPTAKGAVAVGTVGATLAGLPGHPFTGVYDVAVKVEVDATNTLSLNGGLWFATGTANGATTDGTHPGTVNHVAMATAVDLTALV